MLVGTSACGGSGLVIASIATSRTTLPSPGRRACSIAAAIALIVPNSSTPSGRMERGGGQAAVTMHEDRIAGTEHVDISDLDEALSRLATLNE